MTEAEWHASNDPWEMLKWMNAPESCGSRPWSEWKPTDRQLRLFACACVRQVWHLLRYKRSRQAVEVAERFADGLATREELSAARADSRNGERDAATEAAWCVTVEAVWVAASDASWSAAWDSAAESASAVARAAQADLLRDIAGNPFRPVTLLIVNRCWKCGRASPASGVWCECGIPNDGYADCPWLTPTVASLAQAAYDARDSETGHLDPLTLAAVADALEEAGCPQEAEGACPVCLGSGGVPKPKGSPYQSTTIPCPACGGSGVGVHPLLAHLRDPGPHVRGCHVVDLLTGRE